MPHRYQNPAKLRHPSNPRPTREAVVSGASLPPTENNATLEFAHEGLTEWKVTCSKDSCSDVDMVRLALVEQIEARHLAKRFKLSTPIYLGSVNSIHAMTITHAISLPLREGDIHYTHTFAIGDMPGPPEILQGRPWIDKYCPEMIQILRNFGKQSIGNTVPNFTRSIPIYSPPLTPPTTPKNSTPPSPELKPTALPPCNNPQIAYFAGGGSKEALPLLAAVESEEFRRKEAQEKFATCMQIRISVEEELHHRTTTARILQTSVQDPGVRGLTGNKEGWLETIPLEFRHFANTVFSDEAANALPKHRPEHDCKIQLRDGATLRQSKLYDMSREELEQLKKLLDLELQRGFIRPSESNSSAPVFFVRDPSNGNRSGQLRLVVDYRDLNSKIKLDEYPIPLTRTVMNDLASADYITSFDVRSGFANLRMSPGHEGLTAFKTFYGLYEYTVMPMGLATAPSIFQRFMNSILNPFLGIFCHAYLDDVVVFTKGSLELHKQRVTQVLETFARNELRLKPHKCKWFRKEVDFLGFNVVCGKGVRMAHDKIQALRDLKPPRGVNDLRSILGMFGFYDKFIPHYSDTVACLNDLLKKDAPWSWPPDGKEQKAFDTLLASVRDDVFLSAFDPELPIRLSTDASDVAYAGMMEQQGPDGSWRPFLFFHHKFKDGEKGWDGPDKELYAIVYAFSHYRNFLAQPKFPVQVFSDHRNLAKFMFTTNLLKSHDGRLGRWWEILSQCNFEIQYLPGKDNVVPDFLSRYGYEASADLPSRTLLTEKRFSPKALADIQSWFKSSKVAPNVREILERRFAKNQNSSVGLVPPQKPLDPADVVITTRTHLEPGRHDLGALADTQLVTHVTPYSRHAPTSATANAASKTPLPRTPTPPLTGKISQLGKSLNLHNYEGIPLSYTLPTNQTNAGLRQGLGYSNPAPSTNENVGDTAI